MESYAKVFSSNITRAENSHKNNLYDLLDIVPAKPLKSNDVKKYTCDFTPKTDKFYIPKKKSRLKVKTVRDIRKSFEQDTYTYLKTDLETQETILFKKIRRGSSRDDSTKTLAKHLLRGDTPISRSTWQMLINLNPEHHTHPQQYVLWNGKYIQVNGSFGGKAKLICNYDLAYKKLPVQNIKKKNVKQNILNRKKGLLRNSLAVKFKPGPLVRKRNLDDSHQKYHIGNIEVIDLPKPGLDIQPKYGTALESTITNFLHNMRKEDGTMSRRWAELAVSVLGKMDKSNAIQLNADCVTFELSYKYNQNRLLMRRDADIFFNKPKIIRPLPACINTPTDVSTVLPEIKDMINRMLDSVEISMIQDDMYIEEQEKRQSSVENLNTVETETNVKDKAKRKYGDYGVKDKVKRKFGELDRLDVTVIRLPEIEDQNLPKSCGKMHCSLGCICASLECTYNLRQHCGRVECMFTCKCDFFKHKSDLSSAVSSELIPGLLNLDNEINSKLAKEEQKFHQTVIVTGEKRILLKTQKRNWKASKKFTDFYNTMSLRHENENNKILSIVALKIDCDNIEPWCMVHKLYKCFCKGKFTESCASVTNEAAAKESSSKDTFSNEEHLEKCTKLANEDNLQEFSLRPCPERTYSMRKTKISGSLDKNLENETQIRSSSDINIGTLFETCPDTDNVNKNVDKLTTRLASRNLNSNNIKPKSQKEKDKRREIISESESTDYLDSYTNDKNETTCSRTNGYEGRKFTDGYYKNTNYKILDMEKNDKRLRERLAALNNNSCEEEIANESDTISTKDTASLLELLCDDSDIFQSSKHNDDDTIKTKRKRLLSETKLVAWLETNYKQYKLLNDQGLIKKSLEPPKPGKVALHSWDFILNRYRERKNLFLISQQKPYRIFMAVHTRNPFFENCININDIRFADLHKYPQTVKNLLINATDLQDNFCILRGMSCCWELIGSVTKVNEGAEDTPEINVECSDTETPVTYDEKESLDAATVQNDVQRQCTSQKESDKFIKSSEDSGSSKWFVMTVENDFCEIRFFRKGFFVKYESIINAISVARISGKTVRLSSKKCTEQSDVPQFGIYAIPNATESCVFIGPYELEDTLGIETIKTILDVRKVKRTRGFWITTNKVDNLKVVENPLSFMHLNRYQSNNMLLLDNHSACDINKNQQELHESSESLSKEEETADCSPCKTDIKVINIKPIKIRKMNGSYHVASEGILKKIFLQGITKTVPVTINPCISNETDVKNSLSKSNSVNINTIPTIPQETIEPAPQIKIAAVFSQNEDSLAKNDKQDRGMFILKPEEINRKLLQSKVISDETRTSHINSGADINDETSSNNIMESESAVGELTLCSTVKDSVFVISDDENEPSIETETENNEDSWIDVWIECTDTPNIGWIVGRRNKDNNLLSFKLPGSEYSDFNLDGQTFTSINIELFKRTKNSTYLDLKWEVKTSCDLLEGHEIDLESLCPEYIDLSDESEEID